jgi:hypothetical protein
MIKGAHRFFRDILTEVKLGGFGYGRMSLQVAILKVLSSHPNGRASLAAMNSDLSLLSGCRDWNSRMKGLAARAPDLDIFGMGFITRDATGWQITDAGREMLRSLETRAAVAEVIGADEFIGEPTFTVAVPPSISERQAGEIVYFDDVPTRQPKSAASARRSRHLLVPARHVAPINASAATVRHR